VKVDAEALGERKRRTETTCVTSLYGHDDDDDDDDVTFIQ